jgi:uncharacterized protein YgiM (DUF1202 family)
MNVSRSYSESRKLIAGIITATAVIIAVFALTLHSFAASSGKILKDGTRVRAQSNTNCDVVTTLAANDSITINGQVDGEGGVWYQITTADGKSGYVRSDLAQVTDGSTVGTIGADGNVTAGDPSIRLVNPVTGTIKSEQNVRVRQDASTSSTIIDSVANGAAVTINGVKNGTDGREWYYIQYTNAEGKDIVGFTRADFVTPSGELTDLTTETSEPVQEETPVEEEPVVEEKKDWDTTEGEDGAWMLLDYNNNLQYNISEIFENLDSYKASATKYQKQVSGLRAALIIFIIIAIAAVGGCVYFFMKLRDSGDRAAFADAEKQRRQRLAAGNGRPTGTRPAGAHQGRPAGAPQGRPAGARPAGAPQGRPAGARPAGAPQGRPVGPNGARPAGAPQGRPVGPNGRPAGAPQGRPVGPNGRPAGAPQGRPVGPNGARPMQGDRPVQRPQEAPKRQMPDDDDFDYGFLNGKGE